MDIYHGELAGTENYCQISEEETDLRRGPWTVEEDQALMSYIVQHGEGRWNSLARSAGLKRTGKSCRLRWLNYLRPNVRRGNITLEEQLLILELHSRWGNRWSKIAQQLPGRTDNEIKNYWRTRVQKHAKQLKCDVNSKRFKDTMRYLWMPRLVERIQAASAAAASSSAANGSGTTSSSTATTIYQPNSHGNSLTSTDMYTGSSSQMVLPQANIGNIVGNCGVPVAENSSTTASSDSFGTPVSDLTDCYIQDFVPSANNYDNQLAYGDQTFTSPTGYYNFNQLRLDFQATEQSNQWVEDGNVCENLWNVDDMWFFQQQYLDNNF